MVVYVPKKHLFLLYYCSDTFVSYYFAPFMTSSLFANVIFIVFNYCQRTAVEKRSTGHSGTFIEMLIITCCPCEH